MKDDGLEITIDDEGVQQPLLHGEAEDAVVGGGAVDPVCPELHHALALGLGEHAPPQPLLRLQHPHSGKQRKIFYNDAENIFSQT